LTSPTMQRYIVEWFSPDFHQPAYTPLLALLLSIPAAFLLSRRPINPSQIMLLVFSAAAALHSVRHIPIFTFVALPLLHHLLPKWSRDSATSGTRSGIFKPALNLALVLAFSGFVGLRLVTLVRQQTNAETEKYPFRAAEFIASHGISGPIFNSYDWGGYLIWKVPEYRVFVDGRADLYGDSFLESYAETYGVTDNWKAALELWHIQAVVVPTNCPLSVALRETGSWVAVYADGQAEILEPRGKSVRDPPALLQTGAHMRPSGV
jgi:hypothetical protein